MRQAADGDRFDIVGSDEGPARENGVGLGAADKPDGRPGAGAQTHPRRGARGPAQPDGVFGDRRADRHGLGGRLRLRPMIRGADWLQVVEGELAAAVEDQLRLVVAVGITDRGGHREPVQLAFYQREGAALRQGVLGGDHQVGAGERPGFAVDGDLLFLHGLQQGRLGAGRGAVELVDQDQMREDGTGTEFPCVGVRCEYRHACHVGGQEIGVPLDAGQLGPERYGQRPGQHGLADAGDVFDEQMAAAQGGHRGGGERLAGAQQDLGQVGDEAPAQRHGDIEVDGRRPGRRVALQMQRTEPLRRPRLLADAGRLHDLLRLQAGWAQPASARGRLRRLPAGATAGSLTCLDELRSRPARCWGP